MATFAPPVRRDNFVYSSILYADAGNNNHHPRASVSELTTLLRPEAPSKSKKTKAQPPAEPAKDQVGHWYIAQLIHYGLPPTKDKNAAKVRLLNALNEGKIEVPGWISKLEAELKRQWDTDNRRLKKISKSAGSSSVPQRSIDSVGSSAVHSTPSHPAFSVAVRVDINQPPAALETTAQATKGTKRKRNDTASAVSVESSSKIPSKKQNRLGASVDNHTSTSDSQGPGPTRKSNGTARLKAQPSATAVAAKTVPQKVKHEPKAKTKPKVEPQKKVKSEPMVKPEPKVKTEKEVKTKPKMERESKVKSEHKDNDEPFEVTTLTCVYQVQCPAVQAMWPQIDPNSLRLFVCKDEYNDRWWASFSWWAWQGLIRMDRGPSIETMDQQLAVSWRLRDQETGDLRFGRRCIGTVAFSKDQTIRCSLYDVPFVGTVEFWGFQNHEQSIDRSPALLQAEWDGFVSEAYGRA